MARDVGRRETRLLPWPLSPGHPSTGAGGQGHGVGLGYAGAIHLGGPVILNHLIDPSDQLLATTRVLLFSNTVDF